MSMYPHLPKKALMVAMSVAVQRTEPPGTTTNVVSKSSTYRQYSSVIFVFTTMSLTGVDTERPQTLTSIEKLAAICRELSYNSIHFEPKCQITGLLVAHLISEFTGLYRKVPSPLVNLELSGNCMGDNSGAQPKDVIHKALNSLALAIIPGGVFENLKTLDISRNGIPFDLYTKDAMHFARAVGVSKLETLKMGGNRIGDDMADCLAVVVGTSKLKYLDVSESGISQLGMMALWKHGAGESRKRLTVFPAPDLRGFKDVVIPGKRRDHDFELTSEWDQRQYLERALDKLTS